MAICRVIGSGSKGNCYLIECSSDTLILDIGVNWSEVLKGLNYNIGGVQGILVSHGHL